jgi:peptide-methionine (R)-S-oxide reductase
VSSTQPHYERRAFLLIAAAGTGGYTWWRHQAPVPGFQLPERVRIAEFDASGRLTRLVEVASIRKPDSEWKRQLAADAYSVTRQNDTELAGTGIYDKFYEDGIYRCICCDTAVFDSGAKYASGTGWPSFTEPIAKSNVRESPSAFFGIRQIEVKCARCDAHLGHVFDDGPPPLNLRYCINSVALRFVARTVQPGAKAYRNSRRSIG